MARIQLVNLCKRYENGFTAVDNASLEIADGEFLVLVGPSGCGKSTTLRMIAGLEDVSSGDIFLAGRRINDLQPGDRDIAMVFQNYALYPHMTVRANMSFGLRMRRLPHAEIESRVIEAAKILGLEPLLNRKPRQLSGGQRQRVALGRAIVRHPKAFLFDEPLSNLDAKLRVKMRTELAKLHQQLGTTTVYVTHDQVEAMTLGSRIVIMKDGVIQQVDKPLNVYNQPSNKFVAGFIGSPAMNFLKGRIEKKQFISNNVVFPLNLTPQQMNSIAATGREVYLGFRPETLSTEKQHPFLIDATIEVVENMGHEVVVYVTVEIGETKSNFQHNPEGVNPNASEIDSTSIATSLVARFQGSDDLVPGRRISLHLPPDRCHLFFGNQNSLGQQVRV